MLEFLHRFHGVSMCLLTLKKSLRDVTRTLIGGGGYSYIHVLPDGFLLNLTEAQKHEIYLFYIKIKFKKSCKNHAKTREVN